MSRLKKHFLIIIAVVSFFGAICLALILPGKVTAEISDGYLNLDCYHIGNTPTASKTLDLSDCEVIFYENYFEEGSKVDALSLIRIKTGRYENNTLGEYFLLRYNRNKSVIILKSDYSSTVFNLKTYEQTFRFYNMLLAAQSEE